LGNTLRKKKGGKEKKTFFLQNDSKRRKKKYFHRDIFFEKLEIFRFQSSHDSLEETEEKYFFEI